MTHSFKCALSVVLLPIALPTTAWAQATDTPSTDSSSSTASDPTATAEVSPPRLIRGGQPPHYPADAAGEPQAMRVELFVVVETDGSVSEVELASEASPAFEREAKNAVRSWLFEPARRGDQVVPSRVRVAVEFEPPQVAVTEPSVVAASDTGASKESSAADEDHSRHDHSHQDSHLFVTVHGERSLRTEGRAATDIFLHREELAAAPHQDGVDTLSVVPGLIAGRGEGLAVAHSYSLRGFHAEHGQDIEFKVGGLPINVPSHIHGQGYSDLNFLVSELVDEASVTEGISDPAQGDFAVAGSIDIGLGVDEEHRGLSLSSSYGSFGTWREALIWAPKEADRHSVGAVQLSRTAGYGDQRDAQLGSAILQHSFGQGDLQFRAIGLSHIARGSRPGVVRQGDVDSGLLCFRCTYDDPSARAQSATAVRLMAGLFADYRGKEHASGSFGFWVGQDRFTSRVNLTGYANGFTDSEGNPVSDLNEQRNRTQSLGLTGRYRTEAFDVGRHVHGTIEVGSDARLDGIAQEKSLIDAAAENADWDQSTDAEATQMQLSMWGDVDVQLGKRLNLRAGARATLMGFEIEDPVVAARLAAEGTRFDDTAIDLVVGPRASVEYKLAPRLSALGSYGHGYRSPSVRLVHEGEEAQFSVVRSGDLGLRFREGDVVVLSTAAYLAYVSSDLVFEPHAGGLVESGATRRAGGLVYFELRPTSWLLATGSVNYVDARVLGKEADHEEETEAEHEEHGHGGEPGDRLQGVAPLSMRLDLQISEKLSTWGAHPLMAVWGLGFTYRSPKPLGEDQWGRPWLLLDASAGINWGPIDLKISAFNLLNHKYATEEYLSESRWDLTQPEASEDHHISAGPPLSLMATLGLML